MTRAGVFILIVTFGTFASAQGPRSAPAAYSELQAYLQLSDGQLQALEQIQSQQDQDLHPKYQAIAEKSVRIRQLLGSGSADAAQIGQLEIDIVNLQKDLSVAYRPYRDRSFALLTADQKRLLPKLADALLLTKLAAEAAALRLIDDPNIIGALLGE